jgi:hypothetical protein
MTCHFIAQGLVLTKEICFLQEREREREREREIGSFTLSCGSSVWSCIAILLVCHIVSLVRHTNPCSQSTLTSSL